MFDKLVESDTAGAEFKNRGRYFLVSTVVVGTLFLTAVVYSLYAADIGFVKEDFEIAGLISPLTADALEPEEHPDRVPSSRSSDDRLTRRVLIEDTDTSTNPPTGVSVEKNQYRTLLADKFQNVTISGVDNDGPGKSVVGRPCNSDCSGSSSSIVNDNEDSAETNSAPPPVIKTKPTIIKTSKVLNGEAISLPKPPFPQPAIILNLQGSVRVQVTIDESGYVVSAKAADGHPLFRQVAEQAARNARFKPTYLNENAVKVTGVIVYNFKRN
jgi:TonB family protein